MQLLDLLVRGEGAAARRFGDAPDHGMHLGDIQQALHTRLLLQRQAGGVFQHRLGRGSCLVDERQQREQGDDDTARQPPPQALPGGVDLLDLMQEVVRVRGASLALEGQPLEQGFAVFRRYLLGVRRFEPQGLGAGRGQTVERVEAAEQQVADDGERVDIVRRIGVALVEHLATCIGGRQRAQRAGVEHGDVGTQDYDIRRRIFIPSRNPAIATINETASGSTDSSDLTLSLGAGYQWNTGPWNLEPHARLTYLDVDVDGYRESGAEASGLNLNVDGQDWTSFTSVVGARVSRSLSHSFGVVVPQARVAWVHEFENNAEEITATYIADPRQNILRATSDEPDRDYFKLGLGLSVVLPGGAQLFVNYDTVLGLDGYSQYVVSLGGRIEL